MRLVWSIAISKGNKYLDSLHTHLCSSAFPSYKCECQPPHLSTMQRKRQSWMICMYIHTCTSCIKKVCKKEQKHQWKNARQKKVKHSPSPEKALGPVRIHIHPHPQKPIPPAISPSASFSTSAFESLVFAVIFHPDIGGGFISMFSAPSPSHTTCFPPFQMPVSNPSSISKESTLGHVSDFLFGKATPAPAPTPLVFNNEDSLDAINIDSPIIVILVPVPSNGQSRLQDTPSMPTPTPTIKLVDSREDICIDMFSSRGCGGGGLI